MDPSSQQRVTRLSLAIWLAVPLSAALVPNALDAQAPAAWPAFTRTFQAYVDSDRVVGAAVLIMKDGKVLAQYNAGFADRSANVRADDETIYHWGSITKTLTAISIMQLRDRGKLSLSDEIVRWVPELRQVHDPYGMMDSITLRMLLSHSAGFQNGTWPYTEDLPWQPFEPTTWAQLVAMMPYQELHFKPGTKYGYSNPGFIYLARVIEAITGDPWDAYVQKNIFDPLELTKSYFRSTPYFMAAHRSHNYYVRKDSSGRAQLIDNGADFDPGITTPNGGWNAPLGDLAKYAAFLTNAVIPGMSRGRYDVVLSRSSFQEMWRPMVPMSQSYEAGPEQSMGLSFFILRRGDRTILGHTGSQAGFRSFLYFDPVARTAVIAAFNTTNAVSPAAAAFASMQQAAIALLQ
ncbi:MAG TPA: serine hydrolase domain-containing protein [Gemmatimonadaceae bacterium]|nr:serine hydrolase domain-containing protein [Gemmatimonadaceae bacterium]